MSAAAVRCRSPLAPTEAGDLLVRLGRPRRFPSGAYVFFEGDPADRVHLVQAGLVKVTSLVGHREVLLDLVGPGELLGELSVIDGGPRSATAVALGPVEVVTLAAPRFREAIRAEPGLAAGVLRHVVTRLRETSRRQGEHGGLDALGRVCRRLVDLADRFGRPYGGVVRVDMPLTQGDLAAWAGVSREAVVKALHRLRSLGWIRTSGRCIDLVDARAIRERAAVGVDADDDASRCPAW